MTLSTYLHRPNAKATWDSICMVCFNTIGEAPSEEALKAPERAHVCVQSPLTQRASLRNWAS